MRVYSSEKSLVDTIMANVANMYATKDQLTINNISWSDKWIIPDGTDFNNIRTVGVWYTTSDVATRQMPHVPKGTDAEAGYLRLSLFSV